MGSKIVAGNYGRHRGRDRLDEFQSRKYEPLMGDFSPHQRNIISRYYDHRDEIMLARLQEIVTELYLADSPAKRKRLWARAATAMKALKIAPRLIDTMIEQDKPELLATNLREWFVTAQEQRQARPRER